MAHEPDSDAENITPGRTTRRPRATSNPGVRQRHPRTCTTHTMPQTPLSAMTRGSLPLPEAPDIMISHSEPHNAAAHRKRVTGKRALPPDVDTTPHLSPDIGNDDRPSAKRRLAFPSDSPTSPTSPTSPPSQTECQPPPPVSPVSKTSVNNPKYPTQYGNSTSLPPCSSCGSLSSSACTTTTSSTKTATPTTTTTSTRAGSNSTSTPSFSSTRSATSSASSSQSKTIRTFQQQQNPHTVFTAVHLHTDNTDATDIATTTIPASTRLIDCGNELEAVTGIGVNQLSRVQLLRLQQQLAEALNVVNERCG